MAYIEDSSVESGSWRSLYFKGVAMPIVGLSRMKRRKFATWIRGWRDMSQAKVLAGNRQDLTLNPCESLLGESERKSEPHSCSLCQEATSNSKVANRTIKRK